MFREYKLGRKLFIINIAVALAAQLLASVMLLGIYGKSVEKRLERRVEQHAQLVASHVGVGFSQLSSLELQRQLSSLKIDPAITRISLQDMDNQPLLSLPLSQRVSDSGLTVQVVVRDGSQAQALLTVAVSTTEVTQSVITAARYGGAFLLLSLLLGVVLASRFQRYATAPVLELSKLARHVIGTRDYKVRAQVNSTDEIGTLAADFNTMLEMVSARDKDLEGLVSERTIELEAANEEWRSEVVLRRKIDREKLVLQQRFENAFTNAPIGMAIVSQDMLILQQNAVMAELFATNEGQHFTIDTQQEDEVLKVQAGVRDLATGIAQRFECEVDCRSGSGDALHCVFSFSSVHDEDGHFQYSILQVNDITESKRLSSELAYQARHDMLTGLANRRVLEQALLVANDDISQSQQPYVLMLMDLDRFKIVNDSCGHAAGDNLLKQLSAILVKAVRPDDIVARLGGDEFSILLYNCNATKAMDIAEQIRGEVESMVFQWEGQTFRIGVSIGLVEITTPQEDTSVIMRKADAACYSAKDGGRNQVFVAPECDQEFVERQSEVQCVRLINDAIDNNDFILFGQPVLPLQASMQHEDPRIEVLLRVRDRNKNRMLPPGAFFPIAERYGLCSKVDKWVVNRLLHMLDVYRDVFADDRRYWVNLSGQSLSDTKFLSYLESVIREANLPPGVINFEITETAIIRNINEARTMMKRLKEFGCQFALDDFGSGLSSFGYLKKLPVDYIKIDGLFVKDIVDDDVDRAFVESIIRIAGIMGIQTVAEFVESMEIAELLKEMGADYGQGFALGRPSELLPAAADRLEDVG